ncbi:hypothetical protein QQ045_029013 [Rhodiola kirilowii]
MAVELNKLLEDYIANPVFRGSSGQLMRGVILCDLEEEKTDWGWGSSSSAAHPSCGGCSPGANVCSPLVWWIGLAETQDGHSIIWRQSFGDLLFDPGSECLKEFPSPESLKRRIIISTKPSKEYLQAKGESSYQQSLSLSEPQLEKAALTYATDIVR